MQLRDRASATLLAQRGHLFGWVPVCFSTGIGIYFALLQEPGPLVWAAAVALAGLGLALSRRLPASVAPLALGVVFVLAGFLVAGLRAEAVSAPVLGFRYYGPIEGRVVEIDRSATDALRLTLDRVVLRDVTPARTPERVRVSLHGEQGWIDPAPGMTVILTGHLSPPNGPVEPGDFDFRRTAWFWQLGAVGYTRSPVLMLRPPDESEADLIVHRLRMRLSEEIRRLIPGDAGGYAAAVTTGDRSGLSIAANDAMRDSNLYHLVSISGMHMGMLVAFVFGLVRYGVALIPPIALRLSTKKIAAAVALVAGAFYLALAGRDVPTERAYIMVAVMLVAVLMDRQALSLRSVALAALLLLALRPEALLNPGFQMSFAAVVALIVAFGRLSQVGSLRQRGWRWVLPVALLLFSSLVAGLATAPYAAAHFNRVAHYGLIANLLAVPVMGMVVMPGAVLLAILGPFGLGAPAAWMVEVGSRWILAVAAEISSWDGAVSAVMAPPGAVLPLFTFGALVLMLWQGRSRLVGVAPVVAAALLWAGAERPAALVAESGGLIGVMTADGRALSKPRGDGFAADNWLRNDGTTIAPEEAAARAAFVREGRSVSVTLGDVVLRQVSGRTALEALEGCGGADILVANVADPLAGARPCLVYDLTRLRRTGALALRLQGDGSLRITTVAEMAGSRPWVPAPRSAEGDRHLAVTLVTAGSQGADSLSQ